MAGSTPKYKEDSADITRGMQLIFNGYENLLIDLNDSITKEPRPFKLCDHIVADISARVHRDKARFIYFHEGINRVDEYKVGGYFAYWISKLRPIYYTDGDTELIGAEPWLNQFLAIYVGLTRANQKEIIISLDEKIIKEMTYNLKYRSASGDDLALFFRFMVANKTGAYLKKTR